MSQRSTGVPDVSFVVRVWLEKRETVNPPEWRFQVRHVQSGEQIHCYRLRELLDFIERNARVPGPKLLPDAVSREVEEMES